MEYLVILSYLGIFIIGTSSAEVGNCDYLYQEDTLSCKNVHTPFPQLSDHNFDYFECMNCKIGILSNHTIIGKGIQDLIYIKFLGSEIDIITTRAFSSFVKKVRYIYLQNNGIKEITADAFWGMQTEEVHLETNCIKNIIPTFLNNLETKKLILNNNQIKTLPNEAFSGSKKLLSLDLSSNVITTIEVDAFVGLQDLRELNLEHNEICYLTLGIFKHLEHLHQLKLGNNKLSRFPIGIFSGLPYLRILNLTNNIISDFNGNILVSCYNLEQLDLSVNEIRHVDAESIRLNVPALRSLRIDDNMLSCINIINIIQFFNKVDVQLVNTVKRYNVQNINGIACLEMSYRYFDNFENFLKLAAEETKKFNTYC